MDIDGHSLVVALASTGSLFFSHTVGYSLSRFKYAGNGIFGLLILVTQMLPATLIIIPLYIMFAGLKLLDTFWGLIIANSTFSLPLCTWTLKGFFDSLPKELEEAAVVDGGNTLGVLFKVIFRGCPCSGRSSRDIVLCSMGRVHVCKHVHKRPCEMGGDDGARGVQGRDVHPVGPGNGRRLYLHSPSDRVFPRAAEVHRVRPYSRGGKGLNSNSTTLRRESITNSR